MEPLELERECIWCSYKQCWVHKQICRWKAFSLGEKRCSSCFQLSLWPRQRPSAKGRRKGTNRSSATNRGEPVPARGHRQLSLLWNNADPE